jgi:biopolymer transport protein ExbB
MKAIGELVTRGGPVMIAIITLSVFLYARGFHLLISLWQTHRADDAKTRSEQRADLRREADDLRAIFRRQRLALGALIAAAPLLGLLGTVSGMVRTFESLSSSTGQKSMAGLAGGISEVLVATESGLAVAIPALVLVALAHWQMHRRIQQLNIAERRLEGIA